MIEVSFTKDGAELIAKLEQMRPRVDRAMLEAVTRLAIDLQRHVMQDKLSGQVLHVRTGTLRRSINYRVQQSRDKTRAAVGTNVSYAHINEYGGTLVRHSMKGPGRAVYPERSFLRSAMKDLEDKIRQRIGEAVAEELKR